MASPAENSPGSLQGSLVQSVKKPVIVSLILLNRPLKALMLKHRTLADLADTIN